MLRQAATLTFTDSGFRLGKLYRNKDCKRNPCQWWYGSGAQCHRCHSHLLFVAQQSCRHPLHYLYTGRKPSMQVTKTGIAFSYHPHCVAAGSRCVYAQCKERWKGNRDRRSGLGSGAGGDISGKEKGIGSVIEWVAFTKLWNATNGLPTSADGTTPDYTLYEDYGWYETKGTSRIFTIKLTASFLLTGTVTGELYTPVRYRHPSAYFAHRRAGDGKSALTCRTVPNLLKGNVFGHCGVYTGRY